MKALIKQMPCNTGEKKHFYGCSDSHLWNINSNMDQFKEELEEALERDARILMLGDMIDAIFPGTDKRHNPSILVKELQGRDDAPIKAIQMTIDFMEPFAENIDLITLGNHELAVWKYHGINMSNMLVMGLNQRLKDKKSKHRVLYGGYTCYMGYKFARKGKKRHGAPPGPVLDILCHHGGGGSAPVSKGMIDVNRKETTWDYDIFLFGHKHNSFGVRDVRVSPIYRQDQQGYIKTLDNRSIQLGTFYKNYGRHDDDGIMPGFEEVGAHQPKPLGGVFFTVAPIREWIKELRTNSTGFKIRAEI